MKKLSTEEFIQKAKEIHGDKYDYSLVEYINNRTKVKIWCNKCKQFFEQTPAHHLNGSGCPNCVNRYKTTEDFIIQAKQLHGDDKFNYSLVKYINAYEDVIIICNKCKCEFLHSPKEHLTRKKDYCPKCYGFYKTNEEFIKEAKEIHGDEYDYSLVDYINAKTKIKIICKKHGIFEQTPNKHISRKDNCPKCRNLHRTTEEFINQLKQIHGNKYDYSLVNFINNKTKLTIICNKHGKFFQTGKDHINGHGCPKCNNSNGEMKILNFLTNNNILSEYQKTFEKCKYKKKLKFDFYLPDYNLCIEFDGQQHFTPYEKFGGQKTFDNLKIKDNIKNEYCINNNIDLLRIPYTEINNIEQILKDKLNLN